MSGYPQHNWSYAASQRQYRDSRFVDHRPKSSPHDNYQPHRNRNSRHNWQDDDQAYSGHQGQKAYHRPKTAPYGHTSDKNKEMTVIKTREELQHEGEELTAKRKQKDEEWEATLTQGRVDPEDNDEEQKEIGLLLKALEEKINKQQQDKSRRIAMLQKALAQRSHQGLDEREERNLRQELEDCRQRMMEAEARATMYEGEGRKMQEKMKNMKGEIDELSDRLAQEMNIKVSSNESEMENISVKSRPMNIVSEYNQFVTTQWLELKDALDDFASQRGSYHSLQDKDIIRILCDIIMTAQGKVQEFQQTCIQNVLRALNKPSQTYSYSRSAIDDLSCPPMLFNAIGEYYRTSAEQKDLSQLVLNVQKDAPRDLKRISRDPIISKVITNYVEAAVQLCWKMVNQRPPMHYEMPGVGQPYDESRQDLNWGTERPSAETVVEAYVYPALYHGEKLVHKGKVLLAVPIGYTGGYGYSDA